nr:GNAT family N-acetyltransferase [Sphingomonas sp.]
MRRDYVNGCGTSPVAFLEGIHVRADHRHAGVARMLCRAVEEWGRAAGCTEMGSDADIENEESHAFHAAIGFEKTERVVFFRKPIYSLCRA